MTMENGICPDEIGAVRVKCPRRVSGSRFFAVYSPPGDHFFSKNPCISLQSVVEYHYPKINLRTWAPKSPRFFMMKGDKRMAKGGNTVQTVTALAEPIAAQLGVSLWDVRFLKEGASWVLRIFIDKAGGVSIDDCVDFTHAINPVLDEADPIEQAYCLEVSSPGLERELTRDAHFESAVGQKVKLRTIRPVDGERDFSGVLEAYADGVLTVRFPDESGLTLAKKETAWVKLDDFGGFDQE